MISQVASVARPSQGFMPNSTPAAVATPLPPWKRKKTGHRWPRNAASPTSATVPSPRPCAAPNCATSQTGTKPFSASNTSVRIAAVLLPERSTLVAPGLPEP